MSPLDRLVAVLDDVDLVFPAHGDAPMTPQDIRDIQVAFAKVCAGEVAAGERTLLEYDVDNYDFGRFSFLLPEGVATSRLSVRKDCTYTP